MINKKTYLYISFIFLLIIAFSFLFYNYTLDIERTINTGNKENTIDSVLLKKPTIYIGVISRYPPNIIYRGYQPILDYLSKNTDYRFELKLSENYNTTVEMLATSKVSAAFIGSLVYVKNSEKYRLLPILKPLNENFEPFSRSVLFTSYESNIKNSADFENKSIALPSVESLSSNWFMEYILTKSGITADKLSEIQHFPHHQTVIYQVVKKLFDAGVTREYLIRNISDKKIRIIAYSEPFPTSPIVVSESCEQKLIDQIKKALLKINKENPNRANITKGWDTEFIYGFVEAHDKDYDIIRKIYKYPIK